MSTLDQWLATWAALDVPASPVLHELYVKLLSNYAEPHRHYHTLQHIAECFDRWQEIRGHALHPSEVEAALWYHDVIYDTRSMDNEARSAVAARNAALNLGVSSASAQRIHDLILSTSHAAEPVGPDAEALVDVDLSILGAEPARFDEYERQIRQEYAWVAEQAFGEGRSGILRQFLARPHIFSTAHFRQHYEGQARQNIQHSLKRLLQDKP